MGEKQTRKSVLQMQRDKRKQHKVLAFLAVIAAFATMAALMVPAISMTHGTLACGMEEHVHTDACYEDVLTCEQEESADHTHVDACYTHELTCEKPAHQHTDACYAGTQADADTPARADAGVQAANTASAANTAAATATATVTDAATTSAPARKRAQSRRAANANGRVGDWLVYLDESRDEITLHVGETITLRPYDEWTWKESAIQTAHWNVGGADSWSIYGWEQDGSNKQEWDNGVFHWMRYVKYDDQLMTRYWSVQGKATALGDYTLTNTKNGHTLTVHVVEGDPVNQPGLITDTVPIKVNLFDYDKNHVLDPVSDTNHANDSGFKNVSINKEAGSSHFYFLSSGGGNKAGESWNDYTKDKPKTGIVKNQLGSDGYPVLNNKSKSLKYLFDTSEASQSWHGGANGANDAMIAYPGVEGMFQRDADGYYYFNSNSNYFFYDAETGESKLYEHTYTQCSSKSSALLANDKPIGFFPFHDYDSTSNLYVNQNHALNHHVGLSMDIDFFLPAGKCDEAGNKIEFDFSGDDDLWVFLQWTDEQGQKHSKLMLDLGGIHQPITGNINFTDDASVEALRPYTLKVFYLERGGCDSNCSIRFNLPITKELSVAKKLTGLTQTERAKYENEEFTYEVYVGTKGDEHLYNGSDTIRYNAKGEVIERGFEIKNGQVTIKDGETVKITGLPRNGTFYVAEEKSLNMDQFEVPHAEREYRDDTDGAECEEEVELHVSQTQGAAAQVKDWATGEYKLEDTEKVTFTNTLKEKDLEVDKVWEGEGEHPDSITFSVDASVEDEHGTPQPYVVSNLKEADGTTNKVFTIDADHNWRTRIEHLPVQDAEGNLIVYGVKETKVAGYATGVEDLTAAGHYSFCNVDAAKLWPDDATTHTEVITVMLQRGDGKFYAGEYEDGTPLFTEGGEPFQLYPGNGYVQRFERLPYDDTYTVVQVGDEDDHTHGLVTYKRDIIQYQLTNTPVGAQEDPSGPQDNPVIHKRIDALRDGVQNPDSAHTGQDLTDLYRLYLDYRVDSLQSAEGVDLLFIIDHSGSMNSNHYSGNQFRAQSVENALNGAEGFIHDFVEMGKTDGGQSVNRWAAVGFKGPCGRDYRSLLGFENGFRSHPAGINDSEILSGADYSWRSDDGDISLPLELIDRGTYWDPNEGARIWCGEGVLTDYTAGFWRAEQFLGDESVRGDGKKKVVVFISDGIPTLHIEGLDDAQSLEGAGEAWGSRYYPDNNGSGGCPDAAKREFGYFVKDMTEKYGYTFGTDVDLYTIGFGASMSTDKNKDLLRELLKIAYGDSEHAGQFMTIDDVDPYYGENDTTATDKLQADLRKIMGMNETFKGIVIEDDLSAYVDLFGLAVAGSDTSAIMSAAKATVTMSIPDAEQPDSPQVVTLYADGAPASGAGAVFTKADESTATIVNRLEYDAATKTVRVVFDPEYEAVEGVTYTLSFDVATTDAAYEEYAESGYAKHETGEKAGQVIEGDAGTDFLGTATPNATSSGKQGFRSNDSAVTRYKHNDEDESKEYPHPVIQVFNAPVEFVKTDQVGAPLAGATFELRQGEDVLESGLVSAIEGTGASRVAKIALKDLRPGTYYLVETQAPAGFKLMAPVKVVVSVATSAAGADTVTVTASIDGTAIGADKLTQSGGTWTLSVMNETGYALPTTGGPGATALYALGMLLLAAGAVLLARRTKPAQVR